MRRKGIPAVQLVPMSEEQRHAFLEREAIDYAEAKSKAGFWRPEEALGRARAEIAGTLGPDPAASGHRMFQAEETPGRRVGDLWYGPMPGNEDVRGARWLYQILVDERLRSRGYGRAMLASLEETVRSEGWTALHLNVFAFNEVALALYQSSGYQVVHRGAASIEMGKSLGPPRTPAC